jgi:hypothetical protein
MDEVLDQNEFAEVVPQETHQEDSHEQSQEVSQEDSRQDRNWRELNRAKKDLERELRMQREMNERLLQMAPRQVQAPVEIDELDSIADEDFIPKGKNKKLVQKELIPIKQEMEELKKELQYRKQQDLISNLQRQYSDFNDVVTPETLALLEEQEPELAAVIASSKDDYKVGMQAYKYIKALGIGDKLGTSRRVKEVDKKLEKNSKTVQSPQAYEKRPMAEAFRMSDGDKSKLYNEMMGYASQSGGY